MPSRSRSHPPTPRADDRNGHQTGGSGRSGALVWRQLADWRAIATIVIACFQVCPVGILSDFSQPR
eukprot:3061956-Rhodomonas_salina.3